MITTENRIGGREEGGNFVAANTRAGIAAYGPTAFGNEIVGNAVGFGLDLAAPLPNGGAAGVGIGVALGAHDNVIGARSFDDPDAGNFVGPHAAPVGILADAGTGNEVGLNTLLAAPGSPFPPVEIGLDGPTPNDPGDADEGANRLQNAPAITGAETAGPDAIVLTVQVDTDPANAAYPLTVRVYGVVQDDGFEGEGYVPFAQFVYPEASAGQPLTVTLPVEDGAPPRVAATVTDADGNTSEMAVAAAPVAAADGAAPSALAVSVGPNPARSTSTVRYALPAAGPVRLTVYDALGRAVAVLADGPQAAGPHEVVFDASSVRAGLYVVRLEAGGRSLARPLTVVAR